MVGPDEETVSWREVLLETQKQLVEAGHAGEDAAREARWIVEEASGFSSVSEFDGLVTVRGMSRHDAMLGRRLTGEPLQYVLGRWPFRTLDLMVDRRVLIPRPETELVAGLAILEIDRIASLHGTATKPLLVADLGTGSGAIGLSVAVERVGTRVWCTDASPDALAVARANCVGLGRPAERVMLTEGSWFEALPVDLLGELNVIASNPPYVSADDALPVEVADWEPHAALYASDRGTADVKTLIAGARDWLSPGGALVLEMAPSQTKPMSDLARSVGFVDVTVHQDLANRDRAVVARVQ